MKVAVLGCGGLGHVHASIYAGLASVELTGVCDTDAGLADALSRQTGAPAFQSFEQMLDEAEFDLLSITLPTYLHKEYTLRAAKARKHIICEKPIALSLDDAAEMIACCEQQGVRLFIGHVVRFFPDYANMKRSIDTGKLGKPAVAHASRVGPHPGLTKSWYNDSSLSGGVIVDLMIHDLDFLRWTLGEADTVYTLHKQADGLDYALVTVQFESGAVANLEANWGYPGPFHTKAEIAGSEGIIRANSLKSSSVQVLKHTAASEAAPFVAIPQSPAFRSPYELELSHFLSCVASGDESIVTAQDAYKALELALAAIESAQTCKAVKLAKEGAQ